MSILLYISFAVFVTYIVSIMALSRSMLFGLIPDSISDSFYLFNIEKRGLGYLFTAWCYIIGISVMALMIDASDGQWFQFLSLFAGGGLCFVGTAPLFKGRERTVHFTGAAVCAASSLVWIVLMGYWFIPVAFSLLLLFAIIRDGKYTFWAEAALFLSMYTTLFCTAQ